MNLHDSHSQAHLKKRNLKFPRIGIDIVDSQKPGILFISGEKKNGLSTTMASICQYILRQREHRILYLDNKNNLFVLGKNKHNVSGLDNDEGLLTNPDNDLVSKLEIDSLCIDEVFQHVMDMAFEYAYIVIDEIDSPEKINFLFKLASYQVHAQIIVAIHQGVDEEIQNYRDSSLIDYLIENGTGTRSTLLCKLSKHLLGIVNQCLVTTSDNNKVAAYQVLVNTPNVSRQIETDDLKTLYLYIKTGASHGMFTRDVYLKQLREAGIISANEAKAHAIQPDLF